MSKQVKANDLTEERTPEQAFDFYMQMFEQEPLTEDQTTQANKEEHTE